MSKHTPGPWFANFYDRTIDVTFESTAHKRGHFHIAKFPMRTDKSLVSHEEWKANARLMAAAPELYEAVKEMLEIEFLLDPRIPKWRAALEKAEGK